MSSVAGGAVGRDHLFPQLPKEEPEPGPTPTIEAPAERLDLATVMRLSQAISGEIVLEKLIDTLLRIALEQAGAERGLLVLLHHDEPRIMAQATIRGDNVQVELRDEVPTAATLPQSVLHYVLRTRQAVSLEDPSAEHQFSADPYIHNRNARSILCLPLITQANLIGVLYLENNLAPRVFAPSRPAVLKLLASQAAIALEIARLHGDLAQREARIRRLVEANVISMFVGDRDGRIADASEAFLRLIGYDREDLLAGRLRWTDLTPPEWHDRTKEATAQLDSTGRIRPFEKEYLRKDGSRVPVLLGAAALEPALEDGTHQAVVFVLDLTERKRAEDELRASEARFRTFVDNASEDFLLLDEDWTVIDVNRQACSNLGYSREELIGKHKSEFDVGLDDAAIQRLKHRMIAGEAITFETRHQRKDGTSFPVEVRVGQFEQAGRRYLCLVRDITERKRAEDELRESEERFRTLVQFSFDVYWESDAQHRFTRQEFGEGLDDAPPPGSEIGKTRWEIPHLEPDADAWRKHRETLDAHLPFRDFELARPAPDGGKRYVSVSGLPVFDKVGQFVGYRGVGRHITERKRVEEALRRSEAYLTEAQRLSHTGTVAFNATAAVYWSEESYRIWGLDALQGLPSRETVLQRIHPDDRERVDLETEEALREKREFSLEFRMVRPDGTAKYIASTGRPLFSAVGELVEMVATHVDVTERKRAQEEHERLRQLESDLAHLNRMSIMGELAASLAHELLHPIAAARNNARAGTRFLDMSPPNLGEVREALACVVRDADRAKDIVGRMRDHIRKAPAQREPFEINEAIHEVTEMVRGEIVRSGVAVRARLAVGLTPIWGDRVQLQQVVVNLVLNAVEAMSSVEEGARELSISTKQLETSDILVAVQDSGPGLDPEDLERVFAAFYTTKTSGMGMGLSICRSIIAAHGGRLWAEANQPRGATFQFTLPTGIDNS